MNAVRTTSRSILLLVAFGTLAGCAGASGRSTSDSDAAQANLNLGVAYLRQGRPDLAIENLERALRLDSRLAPAHNALAVAYDQIGNADEAERHFERSLDLEPANPSLANSYAVFLCRRNRWDDAEPYFRRAIASPSYPTPAAALTNAGHCARDAGELDRAEAYFREALQRDSSYPDALAGLMEISYRAENYLQARAFMQRYIDARPPSPAVLLLCYNIERELDDRAAADRCAQRLRSEFPQSQELAQLRQFERDAR
jgi:type IV pilus assembly protein PilF